MPRKTAGRRYPWVTTDARDHDHMYCRVAGKAAELAGSGAEPWGTPHCLPPLPGEDQVAAIRQRLFHGRDCPRLVARHGRLSVSVTYLTEGGELVNDPPVRRPEGYVLVVRVWPRPAGNKEIARRVGEGEQLAYNILREQ